MYRFEASVISRAKGGSVHRRASYILGKTLLDAKAGKKYGKKREDVVWQDIFLPDGAPLEFRDIQTLCDAIERAEKRSDARTAHQYVASLPNNLPPKSIIKIAEEFIKTNFVSEGLCVIAAIHEGHNEFDAKKNNPHLHILVSTRKVEPNGFNRKKWRVLNSRSYLIMLRRRFAEIQNREYEYYQLPYRVSPDKERNFIRERTEQKVYTR